MSTCCHPDYHWLMKATEIHFFQPPIRKAFLMIPKNEMNISPFLLISYLKSILSDTKEWNEYFSFMLRLNESLRCCQWFDAIFICFFVSFQPFAFIFLGLTSSHSEHNKQSLYHNCRTNSRQGFPTPMIHYSFSFLPHCGAHNHPAKQYHADCLHFIFGHILHLKPPINCLNLHGDFTLANRQLWHPLYHVKKRKRAIVTFEYEACFGFKFKKSSFSTSTS